MEKRTGAQLLVQCLEKHGVKVIFGIPGAKIDAVFDALVDSSIQLVLCRHEQNAAFMAGVYGRLTETPGVVLVTSGPGVSNLTTGLLTATTENDPIIAIGGNVPLFMSHKNTHQNTKNAKLLEAVTKSSVEITHVRNIPEVIDNAFRTATCHPRGSCFISLPQDISLEETELEASDPPKEVCQKVAKEEDLQKVAQLIESAKSPVLLLGNETTSSHTTEAIRELLKKHSIPVVITYQAAGVISRDLLDCFVGRVGLFNNQPGDILIDSSDLIVTVGFNPVEYDPEVWNKSSSKQIIHIRSIIADIHLNYKPILEICGDIAENIKGLTKVINKKSSSTQQASKLSQELKDNIKKGKEKEGFPIHPMRFIYELESVLNDQTTVCCDIGSVYMWMARYFLSFKPKQLLFSNGQQTLGVALPWAIGANYALKDHTIISISGDGGFLFSAAELETAVREKLKLIHFIWKDYSYNMVKEQQLMKYNRESGVEFGSVNIPDFAKAFGALGLELTDINDFKKVFETAIAFDGPCLIDVPIDYKDNPELFKTVNHSIGH